MAEQEIKRPMEGWYLRDALEKLARINAIAFSLEQDLQPPKQEDIDSGAETLTQEQIAHELNSIRDIVTSFVLYEVQAKPEEWYAATDKIA